MLRRIAVFAVLGALVLTSVPGPLAAQEQSGPPEVPDTIEAYSIVPPGQDGNVTPEEVAAGDYGPHFDDQREIYASLVDDEDVTDGELKTYFHSMQFGPKEVEREYQPIEGVTVYRDESA